MDDLLTQEPHTLENTISFGQSVMGYDWQLLPTDERRALMFSQKLDLPEIVARLLAQKELSLEDLETYLQPSLRTTLPNPSHLLDMDKAAERLANAVMHNENIAVFGDYDVDGATSSSLLKRFFKMLGRDARIYIPDRIAEGYGPNAPAMLQLKAEGAHIIVTVDCGTVSYAPITAAREAGLEVIVVDHHIGNNELPDALAVINPNRLDETSPHRHLAAVGVSFLLAVAVNRCLRERGYYQTRKEPDLMSLLDLVALGTVCDVMSLTGLNRSYVSQGLKVLAKRGNIGLAALADVAGMNETPGVYHLGFVLGPRINAGGRIGEASLGARLLSCEDYDEARQIAVRLNQYNLERKAIETMVLEEAMAQAETQAQEAIIIVYSEGWHPGVIGIVAGRIKEWFNRPVAVVALENGIGKASARSIAGVDLGSAVVAAKEADLLVAGGGHAMAAGFTVEVNKLEALRAFLSAKLAPDVAIHGARKTLDLCGILSVPAATPALLRHLAVLEPFGVGNPEPRFVLSHAQIIRVDKVGAEHLRCIVRDGSASNGGGTVTAMAFRSVDTPLGDALQRMQGKRAHLAGKLRLNVWQGVESAQFLVDDIGI